MRILLIALFFIGGDMGAKEVEKAIFAGGCFWCTEADFDHVDGVQSTTSGYTGGSVANPTYEQVSSGKTGHTESLQVVFDPEVVSYKELLDVFWKNHDPTVKNSQFCDVGDQYRAEIFYHNERQKELAEESKKKIIESGRFKDIYTKISPATVFYPAEEYHQNYYEKNPIRYKFYRFSCGRDKRLKELWK